jgi:predicted permease
MAKSSWSKGVFPRYSVSEDVRREIDSHIALRTEELIEAGWESGAAREEALRLFGDRAAVSSTCEEITKSHHRAVGRMEMMGAVWQDIRYGARALLKSPSFAFVAIFTLALGIGANTAIFSVVNGVLLRSLPYPDAQEIVWIRETTTSGGTMSVAGENFRDWRAELESFDGLAAYGASSTTVLGGEVPVQARVANVTTDFWSVFGVAAPMGRLTAPEDHTESSAPVAVVSRSFWENQLSAVPMDELALELTGVRAQVIGVIDGFDYPGDIDIWVPAELRPRNASRSAHNWRVVGRLRNGVPLARASEEVDALTKVLIASVVGEDPDYLATGAVAVPLQDQVVGEVRTPLLLLLGAAALVLLVACTNLASTLLARGTSRSRELAVRMSLGAPKGRIIRQLLTESLVIAALGATAGVVMASGVMQVLQRMGANSVPRLEDVTIDGWVLAYTAVIAVLTAFLFGLVPAVRLTAREAGDAMRAGSRGNAVEGRAGIWRVLVGTEVGLALVLLVGSGLLIRSSQELLREDVGVDAHDVATARIALSTIKYESEYDHARWYDALLTELDALPGVSRAGVISALPVSGSLPSGLMELDGDVEATTTAGYVVASGGAFQALDIPLLQGRLFDERDVPEGEHVAIVSRAFAEAVWPGLNPVGRQVTGGGMDNFYSERIFARVVGVVGDVRYRDLGAESRPTVYFPHSQRPFRMQFGASLVVEAAQGEPGALSASIRSTIQRLDPDIPLSIVSQDDLVVESMTARRFIMMLFGAFAGVALLLASIGIYGVVSYSVARRTREMGIRIALGADAGLVQRMVVRASMQMIVGGLALGLVAALGLTRLMVDLLYGIAPNDPLTMAAVVAVLGATGFLSSWLPARASTRVDPMVTMRAE